MCSRRTLKLYIYLIVSVVLHDNKVANGGGIYCSNDPNNCLTKSKCDSGRDEQDYQGFPEKNCYCDPLCHLLRDCCDDYDAPEVETSAVETLEIARNVFKCVYVNGVKYPMGFTEDVIGVTMVVRCDDNWADDVVKVNCESGDNTTILLTVPVSEPTHNLVFRNMYCAMCNHYDTFTYWNSMYMCRHGNDADCYWEYKRPFLEMKIRMCPLHITETCIGDINSSNDKESIMHCENGNVSLVYSSDGTVYRNEQCAYCSGVEQNDTFCECNYYLQIVPIVYGLTLIVDLNDGQMTLQNGDDVSQPCQHEDMYDPITESCISCESPVAVTRGVCRNTDNQSQNISRFHNSFTDSFTFDDVNVYLSMVTLIASLVALVATFVIYACFKELRNTPGKILMCLIVTLFVAELLFLVSSQFQASPSACKIVGIGMHYFFLAAFCWMNIVALDLSITFSRQISFPVSDSESFHRFLKFSVYGWCVPLAIVCIAVIVDFSDIDEVFSSLKPGYGATVCWITSRDALIVFFFGPFAIFKLFDVAAFIFTSVHIFRARRQSAMARQNTNVCTYLINLKLSLVMGLTWTFAFLANIVNVPTLWYIFVVLNGLQGVFIGLGFLCTNKVRRLLSSRFEHVTRTQSSTQMSTLSTVNH